MPRILQINRANRTIHLIRCLLLRRFSPVRAWAAADYHKFSIMEYFFLLIAFSLSAVYHSNGITFLQAAQSGQAARIAELHAKGVAFMACKNTVRERKITRGELLPQSGTVPSGIMEVIKKREKNWAYLRVGL